MKIMPRMFSAEASLEMYNNNDVSYEYVLQRDDGQWTATQKNKLIDSIMRGFLIPNIWALEESQDRFIIVDGKQRLSTIFSYMNDEWKLVKTFEPIYYKGKHYEVAGKRFSELDPVMQKVIKLYPINYSIMLDFEEDQIEEQFMRLNSGTPFKPTQKIRVALGTQVTPKFDEKVLNHPFWDRCASTIAKSKTDAKLGVALESLMLLTDYKSESYKCDPRDLIQFNGCGSAEIMKFAEYYRDNYKESDLDEFASLLDLLDECYPMDDECVPYLKKLHLPALMVVTKMFKDMLDCKMLFNDKVKYFVGKEDFEEWLRKWTTKIYKGYYFNEGCKEGTTKVWKLEKRVTYICNSWRNIAEDKVYDYIDSVMGKGFDYENGDYSLIEYKGDNGKEEVEEEIRTEFVGIFAQDNNDNDSSITDCNNNEIADELENSSIIDVEIVGDDNNVQGNTADDRGQIYENCG